MGSQRALPGPPPNQPCVDRLADSTTHCRTQRSSSTAGSRTELQSSRLMARTHCCSINWCFRSTRRSAPDRIIESGTPSLQVHSPHLTAWMFPLTPILEPKMNTFLHSTDHTGLLAVTPFSIAHRALRGGSTDKPHPSNERCPRRP